MDFQVDTWNAFVGTLGFRTEMLKSSCTAFQNVILLATAAILVSYCSLRVMGLH